MNLSSKHICAAGAVMLACALAVADPLPKDTGYRGIWYFNQPTNDEFVYKYSGGYGTYCADHIPFAVYAPKVKKTFFVYGGAKPGNPTALVEMVSYYDHKTGQVPRPTILLDKQTEDAHDNPVIALDKAGYVWVFASAHGTARPAYIFKSDAPYSVDGFTQVLKTNYSYPQPWYVPKRGFLFLETRYKDGRGLCYQTSPDGAAWSDPKKLAHIDEGHYQISWPRGKSVGTAFNYHPNAFQGDKTKHGLNWRTNVYYLETADMGKTWRTAAGSMVSTPLTEAKNPALVHDYESEGWLAYLSDLNYDAKGHPIILHVISRSWKPGPGPRELRIARWTGAEWKITTITTVDHNYDMGSLYIERGKWRAIFPTEPGPQPYGAGGEVAIWESTDHGETWNKFRQLTHDSPLNHTYIRRPLSANKDFYAYWADGNPLKTSESHLYFANRDGTKVYQLPSEMNGNFSVPKEIKTF